MHNIKLIRKDPIFFAKKLDQRNTKIDLENLLNLDKKNRELIQKREKLENEKKNISKKKDKSQFSRSRAISKEIDILNKSQLNTQDKIEETLASFPNIALEDVPIGKDETANKEIKKIGKIPDFKFRKLTSSKHSIICNN